MEDRRYHPRRKMNCSICLSNEHFGPIKGNIRNMSENGVLVEVATSSDFSPGMLFEAKVLDPDWDQTLPPLMMKVVRVDKDDIALEFII
ncbi:MAG: PilZ domain-containing protein [Oceanisphaera sp.]|nr:PilZ domain-containing protein [Oceanisphaera sp.]